MISSRAKKGPAVRRCPACGQRIKPPVPPQCPLCAFEFFTDDRATGADVTPYATAFSCSEPGWRKMCEWVWFADTGRLKHLALMRSSAASRNFATRNMLALVVGLAFFQASSVGWMPVRQASQHDAAEVIKPTGQGWFHIAAAPRPLDTATGSVFVDLWWSPTQMVIAVVVAVVDGLLFLLLIHGVVRVGIRYAHTRPLRNESRMTAALHYSSASAVPIVAAGVLCGLRPIGYVGAMQRWSWYPHDNNFVIAAAVLGGFGAVLWWFWLLRLAAAAPKQTRARVVAFASIGVPIIVVASSAAWWIVSHRALGPLFRWIDMQF